MSEVTVGLPNIGTLAYFGFKEPFNTYITNTFNINISSVKLEVVSIISMSDRIRTDLRDPFTDIYDPAGLTEVDYKLDLNDEISLISFRYIDDTGVERNFRVPHNYLSSTEDVSNIDYLNRLLVLDLGKLPSDIDLSPIYNDIKDFITSLTGVEPELKDVTIGDVEFLSQDEHETREIIRSSNTTVHKTLLTRLEECTESRDEILLRLEQIGISLSDEFVYTEPEPPLEPDVPTDPGTEGP